MRLGQVKWNGQPTAAIFDGNRARPIPDYTMIDLVRRADSEKVSLKAAAQRLASVHEEELAPQIPIWPREVWACGCTYEMSASFRDAEHGTREGFYRYVFESQHRPEIFFKGTWRVCVGPDQPVGIRPDSKFTAPEPEFAVILGSHGRILGYTLANDVSAWDIERENPLYLPQSKTFTGCCALGPYIIPTEDVQDPYSLEMTCTIERGNTTTFSGSTSTAKLNRKFEVLIEYLLRGNPVPAGTVLLTGTGIIVTEEAALAPGDTCKITVPEFGTLSNPAVLLS
jgi:2-dehydro-3-deoxy-D-arabinonate dehydratase